MDLETGQRIERDVLVEEILCEVDRSGGGATVVNKQRRGDAAGAWQGWRRGREVVVSRGQLIEIGGSFPSAGGHGPEPGRA